MKPAKTSRDGSSEREPSLNANRVSLKSHQAGLSLFELVVAIVLLGFLLFAMSSVHVFFSAAFGRTNVRALLYLHTVATMERIVSDIKRANYIEIDVANSVLTIAKKNQAGAVTKSKYYLQSSKKNLYYQKDLSVSPLPAPELIQPTVQTFNLTGVHGSGGRFQAVRIKLEAKDSQSKITKVVALQSLAACRVFSSDRIIRVVDSSRTIIRGYYGTIKAAIENATTVNTDIVQISCNDKKPYVESVQVNKSLTFEGAYDNIAWARHQLPSGSPEPAYETIITSTCTYDFFHKVVANPMFKYTVADLDLNFDGLTFRDMGAALTTDFASWDAPGLPLTSLSFKNCLITNNIYQTQGVIRPGDITDSLVIDNTQITSNPNYGNSVPYRLVNLRSVDTLTIKNSKINSNSIYYGGWPQNASFLSAGNITNFSMINSTINGNSASFYSQAQMILINLGQVTTMRILNSEINKNQILYASGGGALFYAQAADDLVVSNSRIEENYIGNRHIFTIDISRTSSFINSRVKLNKIPGSSNHGVLYLNNISEKFLLSNCQILNNSASHSNWTSTGNHIIYVDGTGGTEAIREFVIDKSEIMDNYLGNVSSGESIVGCRAPISQLFSITNSKVVGNMLETFSILSQNPNIIFLNASTSAGVFNACSISDNSILASTSSVHSPAIINIQNLQNSVAMNNVNLVSSSLNAAAPSGGALIATNSPASVSISNSILYNNSARFAVNSNFAINYSDIQGGYATGKGNINANPFFVDAAAKDYHLTASASPAVDAGHPYETVGDEVYLDPALESDPGDFTDPANPVYGTAAEPAKGTRRNDMGAYGGPGAGVIGFVQPTTDDPTTPDICESMIGTFDGPCPASTA